MRGQDKDSTRQLSSAFQVVMWRVHTVLAASLQGLQWVSSGMRASDSTLGVSWARIASSVEWALTLQSLTG